MKTETQHVNTPARFDAFDTLSEVQFLAMLWLIVLIFLGLALFPASVPINSRISGPFSSPNSGYDAPWVHPSQMPRHNNRGIAASEPSSIY